jgi:hypothetical protein
MRSSRRPFASTPWRSEAGVHHEGHEGHEGHEMNRRWVARVRVPQGCTTRDGCAMHSIRWLLHSRTRPRVASSGGRRPAAARVRLLRTLSLGNSIPNVMANRHRAAAGPVPPNAVNQVCLGYAVNWLSAAIFAFHMPAQTARLVYHFPKETYGFQHRSGSMRGAKLLSFLGIREVGTVGRAYIMPKQHRP